VVAVSLKNKISGTLDKGFSLYKFLATTAILLVIIRILMQLNTSRDSSPFART
jgi:hypothetical protein